MSYVIDGINKIISPADAPINGEISIDVQDMYSRWVDWFLISDNSKFLPAMRVVGGDSLPEDKKLGITYFLLNGWKIRPYEANHTFILNGNIYSEDGSSPFIQSIGSYNISILVSFSNLVDTVVTDNTILINRLNSIANGVNALL